MSLARDTFIAYERLWNAYPKHLQMLPATEFLDLGTIGDVVNVSVAQTNAAAVAAQDTANLEPYLDEPMDVFMGDNPEGEPEAFDYNSTRIHQIIDERPPQLAGIERASHIFSSTTLATCGSVTIRQCIFSWQDVINSDSYGLAAGFWTARSSPEPTAIRMFPEVKSRHVHTILHLASLTD